MSIVISNTIKCDKCGTLYSTHLVNYQSVSHVRNEARKVGWRRAKENDKMIDLCDDCFWVRHHAVQVATKKNQVMYR